MKLPSPTASYDPRDQANVRRLIESDNANLYKRNQDVEIGSRKITPPNRLIISIFTLFLCFFDRKNLSNLRDSLADNLSNIPNGF